MNTVLLVLLGVFGGLAIAAMCFFFYLLLKNVLLLKETIENTAQAMLPVLKDGKLTRMVEAWERLDARMAHLIQAMDETRETTAMLNKLLYKAEGRDDDRPPVRSAGAKPFIHVDSYGTAPRGESQPLNVTDESLAQAEAEAELQARGIDPAELSPEELAKLERHQIT